MQFATANITCDVAIGDEAKLDSGITTEVDAQDEWVLPKTTIETCSNCITEVEIPANEPSKCPKCQAEIFPCSTCYDEIDGRKPCDWDAEYGCWRFPKTECERRRNTTASPSNLSGTAIRNFRVRRTASSATAASVNATTSATSVLAPFSLYEKESGYMCRPRRHL